MIPSQSSEIFTRQMVDVTGLHGLRNALGFSMEAAEQTYGLLYEQVEAANRTLGDVALRNFGIELDATEKFVYPDDLTPARDIEVNFGWHLRGVFGGFMIFDRKWLDQTGDIGRTGIKAPTDRYEICIELWPGAEVHDGNVVSVPSLIEVPLSKIEGHPVLTGKPDLSRK
ncbi:MAG: hypothetical protein ACXWLH_04900 [Candidatus Saccharimonadales bacterium]